MRDAEARSSDPHEAIHPGTLTALLRRLAEAPAADPGGSWDGALRPGVVVGRFELVRELGRGGFGVVWEAKDRQLGRSVAFKAVRAGGNPALREERLLQEAEAAARLSHPNIVTLHDVGRAEQGAYLVLELLRGETLAQRLPPGPLSVHDAVHVATEVARGVAHAHAHGVVHRDLKPENVFLCDDGRVKVLDFGLAHAFGQRRVDGGTPAYMAPEQWDGAPEDERTDVFALGVLLYRMLAGKLPFPLEGAWAQRPGSAAPIAIAGLDPLGPLLARMIERCPTARPRDAGVVLAELEAIATELSRLDRGKPLAARELGFLERLRTPRAAFARGRARRGAIAVGMAVTIAAGGWYAWSHRPTGAMTPVGPPSIAVLPFADLSPSHDQEYFCDGVAEEILTALSHVQGLRVPSRASSFWFKGKGVEQKEIGRKLGVAHLLEGSVRRVGTRLRIRAEVVTVASGERLWAQTFDRELIDVFAVQDEIARSVVDALQVKLLGRNARPPRPARPTREDAYESYLLGLRFAQRFTAEDQGRAVAAFEKAVALDAAYVPAWLALSTARYRAGILDARPWPEARRDSLAAASRAAELDPELAAALAGRGLARLVEWDWPGAKADIDRALQLDPGDRSALAARATYLAATGELGQALPLFQRAAELDPLDGASWNTVGVVSWFLGRHDEAAKAFARVLEIDPSHSFAAVNLGGSLLDAGRPAEALALCERLPEPSVCVACAHHRLGHAADAQRVLDVLVTEPDGSYHHLAVARALSCMGRSDEAFRRLEQARLAHDRLLVWLLSDPFLRSLHGDPRWAAFLGEMELPAATDARRSDAPRSR